MEKVQILKILSNILANKLHKNNLATLFYF